MAAIQYIGGARAVRGSLGKPPLLKRVAAAGLTRLRDPKSANRRWLFLTRFAAAASRLVPNDSLAILSRSIHDSPAMHSRCTHDALATFLCKSLNPPKRVILQVGGEKPRRPPQLSPRASKSVAAAGGTGPGDPGTAGDRGSGMIFLSRFSEAASRLVSSAPSLCHGALTIFHRKSRNL